MDGGKARLMNAHEIEMRSILEDLFDEIDQDWRDEITNPEINGVVRELIKLNSRNLVTFLCERLKLDEEYVQRLVELEYKGDKQ